MYSLHFQSERTYALLYLSDYELNQRLNLDWESCYKCCDSLVFIHQVQIIKCQKPSHVFFVSRTRVMAFNIIKCSLGLVVYLDAAVLFIMDACQNISYFCGD